MKRFVSTLLALVMLLGSCIPAIAADSAEQGKETVSCRYKTSVFTEYADPSLNPFDKYGLRFKVNVPNYLGTVEADLKTTEGSGLTDVLVIYVPDEKWDGNCYYSGITASVKNTAAYHIYNGTEYIVKWREWYNYGFFPEGGGVYVYDGDAVQMNFLQGPGLYTAYATVPLSLRDSETGNYPDAYAADSESILFAALGYPFVLILNDTMVEYYLQNGKLENVSSYDWPELSALLDERGCVFDGSSSSFGLQNFTKKDGGSYFRGKLYDLINDEEWYMPYIISVYEYGLMRGYPDNTFRPQEELTLAEVITVASKMNDIYYGGSGEFSPGQKWYSVLVNYAISKGIIGENEFDDYNRKATLAEVARIFAGAIPEGGRLLAEDICENPDLNGCVSRAELSMLIAKLIDSSRRTADE